MADTRLNSLPTPRAERATSTRRWLDRAFLTCCIVTAVTTVCILIFILGAIFLQGAQQVSWRFITAGPSANARDAGVGPALWGTIWVCGVCALLALPTGVGTAILLEEFRPRNRWVIALHHIIQLNITNLAGVPSVVYGILGLTAFVSMFGLLGRPTAPRWEIGAEHYDQFETATGRVLFVPVPSGGAPTVKVQPDTKFYTSAGRPVRANIIGPRDRLPGDADLLAVTLRLDEEGGRTTKEHWYHLQLPFGRGVLAGALTLMLVTLPTIIISTQEALRAVPNSLRDGALALGATRWQVVWNVSLPASIPGIMTGSILSMSRAIGEAAPVLVICGIVYVSRSPRHLMDGFTVLPLQIFSWAQRPQPEFHALAASGIIVLLVILLFFNGLAIFLRGRFQKPLS